MLGSPSADRFTCAQPSSQSLRKVYTQILRSDHQQLPDLPADLHCIARRVASNIAQKLTKLYFTIPGYPGLRLFSSWQGDSTEGVHSPRAAQQKQRSISPLGVAAGSAHFGAAGERARDSKPGSTTLPALSYLRNLLTHICSHQTGLSSEVFLVIR